MATLDVAKLAQELADFNSLMMTEVLGALGGLTGKEDVFWQTLCAIHKVTQDPEAPWACLLDPSAPANASEHTEAWDQLMSEVPDKVRRSSEYRAKMILDYFARGAQYDPLELQGLGIGTLFNLLRVLGGRATDAQQRAFKFPDHRLCMGLLRHAFERLDASESALNREQIQATVRCIPTSDTLALIKFMGSPRLDEVTVEAIGACFSEQRTAHGMNRSILQP